MIEKRFGVAMACLLCFAAGESGAAVSGDVPLRSALDPATQWRLEDMFPDGGTWEKELAAVENLLPRLGAFSGKLGISGGELLGALRQEDEIGERLGRVYAWAHMKSHEDTANTTYQGYADRATMLSVKASSAGAFLAPEILALSPDVLERFFQEEPALEHYRFALARLTRVRDHVLPAEQELLLAQMGQVAETPETVFSLLTNADLKFPRIQDEEGREVELSEERYSRFIFSSNRTVRRDAFQGLLKTYEGIKNTLAATLSGSIKKDVFFAQARRYPSALEASLFSSAIPSEVYTNAIKTVNNHLAPMHRYMALKKKALALDELHMYDLYVPLAPELRKDISWDEARRLVREALAPLGPTYVQELEKGFTEGWIDIYENKGKRNGAYSWGAYGVHPYVLLNYNGTLRDVFTLAHEMGHAMHRFFTQATQSVTYAGHTTFTAEVASVTNEILLLEYLLRTTPDRASRVYLLNYALEQIRTTVYRQMLFAEFEMETHRRAEAGEPLTPDVLSALWRQLNERYYGPDVVVDPELEMEWARIPHFYSAFYVYQYATGFAAAADLAHKILTEGPSAVERYLAFLKSGDSAYSIDLLKAAGVDMSGPEPLEAVARTFSTRLDQLQALMEEK